MIQIKCAQANFGRRGAAATPRVLLGLLAVGIGCAGASHARGQGRPPGVPTVASSQANAEAAQQNHADVAVLVMPVDAMTANVGLAYKSKIDHSLVMRDIHRLEAATGWSVDPRLQISDESVHPTERKRFPATTGALFTLHNAAQVWGSAPVLRPYLQAFQRWNHVEVLFALPDLIPYRGVDTFDSKGLSVRLIRGQGVYRYAADIRDHTGALPALTGAAPAETARATAAGLQEKMRAAAPASSHWPLILSLLGSALCLGGAAYLAYAHRPSQAAARQRGRLL